MSHNYAEGIDLERELKTMTTYSLFHASIEGFLNGSWRMPIILNMVPEHKLSLKYA